MKAPNGVLTRSHAWDQFQNNLFGGVPSTLAGLLLTLADPVVAARFEDLPDEIIESLESRLIEKVGLAAEPAVTAVMAGDYVELIPLGLFSRVVYSGGPDNPDLAAARGWMQAKLGSKPSDGAGLALAAAAEENYGLADSARRTEWQERVGQLLVESGLESEAWRDS